MNLGMAGKKRGLKKKASAPLSPIARESTSGGVATLLRTPIVAPMPLITGSEADLGDETLIQPGYCDHDASNQLGTPEPSPSKNTRRQLAKRPPNPVRHSVICKCVQLELP